jgi:hypothetical protein
MANELGSLTPERVCDLLRSAGFACSSEELNISAREDRWAVALPGGRMAWLPASATGEQRLAAERGVLQLLTERCRFAVPRVLFVSPAGFDVRQMVPGHCDPWGLYHRCQADSALARRIGRWIGFALAEQHTAVGEADVAGWLPRRVPWPESGDWIAQRLPEVIDDRGFIRAMEDVIRRYEALSIDACDCALVHGDVGLHNLALDPATDAINGMFDYDSAAWADRHHDFCYLLFDVGRDDMLDAALEAYEPSAGRIIDRGRVRLYNAACAINYLAFRSGTSPDQKSCGRTLAEDLRWIREALGRLASPDKRIAG